MGSADGLAMAAQAASAAIFTGGPSSMQSILAKQQEMMAAKAGGIPDSALTLAAAKARAAALGTCAVLDPSPAGATGLPAAVAPGLTGVNSPAQVANRLAQMHAKGKGQFNQIQPKMPMGAPRPALKPGLVNLMQPPGPPVKASMATPIVPVKGSNLPSLPALPGLTGGGGAKFPGACGGAVRMPGMLVPGMVTPGIVPTAKAALNAASMKGAAQAVATPKPEAPAKSGPFTDDSIAHMKEVSPALAKMMASMSGLT